MVTRKIPYLFSSEALVARLAFLGTMSARIEERFEERLEESAFCGVFGCESMTIASNGFGGAVR